MKKLIKKDINLMSRYLLMLIALPLMASIIASLDRGSAYSTFMVHIIFFSSATIDSSIRDDNKAKSNMLFSSFPIDRIDAIKSKYTVYALVPLLYSLTFYISVIGVRENSTSIQSYFFTDAKLGSELVILSIALTLIVFSVLIPVLNKGGNGRIFMGIIIASMYLLGARFTGAFLPKAIFSPVTWIILLAISIVAYLLSLKVAINMEVKE